MWWPVVSRGRRGRIVTFVGVAVTVPALLAGCSGGSGTATTSVAAVASGAASGVEIATDLPLKGSAGPSSTETNQAIQLYLDQVGRTGGLAVSLRTYDDATEAKGSWDDETCVRNAHDHLRSREVAVMGTYNSGCARLMVPVMNQASDGPLVMVSHANSNPGLTKPWGPNEPAKFAPSGTRSFARVTATDEVHGAAAASFLHAKVGARRCYVVNDGQVYGRGVAAAFVAAAKQEGITVLGNTVWDVGRTSYRSLFESIKQAGPDCVYVAGVYENNAARVVKDKVAVLGDNLKVALMAPDGLEGYPELMALPEAANLYLTFGGLSLDRLVATSPKAAAFVQAYTSRYGKAPLSAYAIYGVAATQVILAAVRSSDRTRKGVHDAMFGTTDLRVPAEESITGRELAIDRSTGDVRSPDMSVLRISGGNESFVSGQVVS